LKKRFFPFRRFCLPVVTCPLFPFTCRTCLCILSVCAPSTSRPSSQRLLLLLFCLLPSIHQSINHSNIQQSINQSISNPLWVCFCCMYTH
jgi:hypothetical protein